MRTSTQTRLLAGFGGAVAIALALTSYGSAAQPKFFNDDPVWVEHDTEDASKMTPNEVDLTVDLTYNFITGRDVVPGARAQNVNSVDEVPDSNWFTNRAGVKALTAADVERGPDTTEGPAAGRWTVTSSKSDGVTPGFTIKDANGQRWFLKFDPRGYRGMSTGTEVAVTKLMWALGYHVPENHISYLRREQLAVGEGAKFTPKGGNERAMRLGDIDSLLERADREPNGTYRVVASKALPGKPVGRIRFYGTRPDDPNDIVAHENRRELRAYGVYAAWLNHVDAKAINSLDMLMTENGRSFVRHNLIDFGSALGSGGVGPADRWAGAEYLIEPGELGKQMISFGFSAPKWQTAKYYEFRSIGRFPKDSADFNPEVWRPRVPNRAFLSARADDKFWAAQRLMALTDGMLRAAVDAGDFGDPAAEEFLVRTLTERRDAIGRAYLTAINPISDPEIDANGELTFRNAAVETDFAAAPAGYRAVWFRFDNATGSTTKVAETASETRSMQMPAGFSSAADDFIKVELSAIGGPNRSWEKPVHAYFRQIDGAWQLVGFERMPELPDFPPTT